MGFAPSKVAGDVGRVCLVPVPTLLYMYEATTARPCEGSGLLAVMKQVVRDHGSEQRAI